MAQAEDLTAGFEHPQRLLLCGYVALSQVGFALPCFGASRLPNQWHVARCSSGDPEGKVEAFEPCEFSDVTPLDDALMVEVGLGDPWVDVFRFDGDVHVGRRSDIWAALRSQEDRIAARAPLSGVDLTSGTDVKVQRRMSRAAVDFIAEAYGARAARDWRRQAARTRFTLRLRRLGLPTDIERLEVVGGGLGEGLSLDCPAWRDLPFTDRQLIQLAASTTARELGLRFRPSGTFRDLLPERIRSTPQTVEIRPPVPSVPRRDWETADLFGPHLLGGSLLILTAGPRAARIARMIRPAGWSPAWPEAAHIRMDVAYQGDWRDPSLPAIHIHDFREDDIGHGYPAVVVLADDDLLDDWGDRHELVARARTHAGPDGVVIIAPALPEDGPSAVLMQANIDLPAGADLLLDTSLARSPLWGLDERSTASLGRLAELVVLAGVACFPGTVIPRRIAAQRNIYNLPRIASIALWDENRFGDTYEGEGALFSESQAPASEGRWLDEYIPLAKERDRRPVARIVVGPRKPGFINYAESLLNGRVRRSLRLSREALSVVRADAPPDLRSALRFPSAVARVRRTDQPHRVFFVTAEKPSIAALRAARRHELNVVRVTDTNALRQLLTDENEVAGFRLPAEVALPSLARFSGNRRLAIRGADMRDVVILPDKMIRAARAYPVLNQQVRAYLRARTVREDKPEWAVPVRALMELAPKIPLAEEMLLRFRTQGGPQRPRDLSALWGPSGFRRYVIADGRFPITVREIEPSEVAPSNTFWMVDGDVAVPLLLGSRLFNVWARLTAQPRGILPLGMSPSRTFETFPILAPFYTTPTVTSGLALFLDDWREAMNAAGRRLEAAMVHLEMAATESAFKHARLEADDLVFELYGLPPYADELEIAERLIELNHERAGADLFAMTQPVQA
jgi:hypothetical protein